MNYYNKINLLWILLHATIKVFIQQTFFVKPKHKKKMKMDYKELKRNFIQTS